MILKSQIEINKYKDAAKLSTEILLKLKEKTREGIYPIEIENLAKTLCKKSHVNPSFLGVGDKGNEYKFATCVSINDTVVHGIPSDTEIIKNGDLVKVDFGINYKGFLTDHCYTVGISPVSDSDLGLMKIGRQAVWQAAQFGITGNRVGDISSSIQNYTETHNCNVIRKFTGHGIGKTLHEEPLIPSFGIPNTGKILKENQVLCIEAQITRGEHEVIFMPDGWTVKMKDGQKTVMFEFMIIVQKNKPLILTNDTYKWDLIV